MIMNFAKFAAGSITMIIAVWLGLWLMKMLWGLAVFMIGLIKLALLIAVIGFVIYLLYWLFKSANKKGAEGA